MALAESLLTSLDRVSSDPTRSSTLPPFCYSDRAVLDAECRGLLRESWLGIGRADLWAKPGDYAALSLAGIGVIVCRDTDGNLRAFANTCRHRGTELLRGSGNVTRIVCPFHGWTYGLDGSLRGATRMGHAQGFRNADYGLLELRAAERAGFAFVCLSPEGPDIDAWLGNFAEHHSPWPLDTLVTTRRRELDIACNWKLFLEVFNESYHLDSVHPVTFRGIYQEPDPPDLSTGDVYTQFSPTIGTGGLKGNEQEHALPMMPGLTGRNRAGTRYTWVFPSLTFAAGTEAVWAYDAQPTGVDRCHVTMWVCFPPETVASPGFEEKASRYYTRMDEALDEDIAIIERQQAGMASPLARAGRWSELERGAAAFAGWYKERLAAA
jgi:phenylpropionate dioxygenase-like ring-hydroxylating dioxygenase large terminal subunit